MAIHRRPPANISTGGFADSACKTCNARIPVVAIRHSTKINPVCTKQRQRVADFSTVFMLNLTKQLQNRHAAYKQPNVQNSATPGLRCQPRKRN